MCLELRAPIKPAKKAKPVFQAPPAKTVNQADEILNSHGFTVDLPTTRKNGVYIVKGYGSTVVYKGNRAGFLSYATNW